MTQVFSQTQLLNIISDSSWFNVLPPDCHQALLNSASIKSYPANSYIFQAGQHTQDIFCLLSGTVEVSVTSSQGRTWLFGNLPKPQWFGEHALTSDDYRLFDLKVVEQAQVLTIPCSKVLAIADKHPLVYRQLFHTSQQVLRDVFMSVEYAVFQSLPARLALLLLDLAKQQGQPVDQGIRIVASLSQSDLARLCLGSRPRINKILNKWADQGLITRDHEHYIILDQAGLLQETQAA